MRWVAPAFFVASVPLWLVAPATVMDQMTPIAGGLALLFAGLYLASVLWRILRLLQHHKQWLESVSDSESRFRRAAYAMTILLFATAAMAVAFYFAATRLLAGGAPSGEARLLWMLTLGGLALSLGFGRLVMAFVAWVDAALSGTGRGVE